MPTGCGDPSGASVLRCRRVAEMSGVRATVVEGRPWPAGYVRGRESARFGALGTGRRSNKPAEPGRKGSGAECWGFAQGLRVLRWGFAQGCGYPSRQ